MNAHTRPPGEAQDAALYIRTPVTPEEAFQAIGRLRKEARDEIDRLIRFLDDTDNHMELEDSADDNPHREDEDEPSLGWTDLEAQRGRHAWSADVDAELDRCDDEESDAPEDGGDAEPDVDDEPGADAEPSFGWSDEEAARGRYPSLMGVQS